MTKLNSLKAWSENETIIIKNPYKENNMNLIRDLIEEANNVKFLIISTHSGGNYNLFPQEYKDIIDKFEPAFSNNFCYLNFSRLSTLLDFIKCFDDIIVHFEDQWSLEIYDDYRE